jgi:hypothetical protein
MENLLPHYLNECTSVEQSNKLVDLGIFRLLKTQPFLCWQRFVDFNLEPGKFIEKSPWKISLYAGEYQPPNGFSRLELTPAFTINELISLVPGKLDIQKTSDGDFIVSIFGKEDAGFRAKFLIDALYNLVVNLFINKLI